MEVIRLLYVEDSPADQELTRRHLERHARHLKLTVVGSVGEALDQLAAGDVDVVLSDFRLPDATGLDLVQAVKARGWMLPVVLVTGSGDADTAVRLLKAGAADYVVKRPGYLDTLPAILEATVRWSQSVRELRRTAVRVLYAEHDPADVELMRRTFREHGPHFQLELTSQGREVLERVKTTAYDLLLLDYRMPDLSGIEILKALREARIQIPVVIVTGQGDEETAVQAFKLGAADYIIKSESALPKIPATLENVLAHRRLADEKDALLVLNSLTRSIATLRDMSGLAQQVASAARDLLRADASLLWLVEGTELQPAAWTGFEEAEARALRLPADEPLLRRLESERRLVISELFGRDARGEAALLLADADRALGVSLVTAGEPVGLLAIASRRPRAFTATEERLLTILADHAGIAIENARLYQRVKDQLEELQRTQAQLLQTEKLAAMGQLLAGVAHELNNPLSVVLGRAALLEYKLAGTPHAAQAKKVAEAADRSARIVKNFLALARQRPTERQKVSLNEVARQAVELLAYQLRVDDVEVRFELAPDLPALWADPNQLHQVVVNLVSNAHHAIRQTPQPRQIIITTRHDAARQQASLVVADTGPGVPPAVQPRIFEPFFTTKAPGQGTGLGLSLCQGIVEGHGGAIRVESRPGLGAVFRVELPVVPPREAPPKAPAPDSVKPIQGLAVLIVDDEPEIAGMLAEILSAEGHQVQTVTNGAVALERLRVYRYDLVLSDIKMPELDGPGFYRELERAHPGLVRRIIFLTGDTLSPDISEFLEKSGVPSLNKPFALEEIRRVVQQTVAGA